MSDEQKKSIYFKNLDIIRFFAAFAVVLAHGFEAWKPYYITFKHSPEYAEKFFSGNFIYLDRFFMNLGIGVEIFFFISGFLISYILLVEKERYGNISIWKFFTRRSLRIWPLYFFLLAFGPFLTSWINIGKPDYLSLYLFYSNFQVIYAQTWEYPFAHYWSIALEEQFYVVWPFIIYFFSKTKLPIVFVCLIVISIFFRGSVFYMSDAAYFQLYLNTLSRIDTLVIGALIAYYYFKNPFVLNLPKGVPLLMLICLLFSFLFVSYNEWNSVWSALFKKYIYLAFFGTLILFYISSKRTQFQNKFKRSLSYLGKISYGIYMYHNILVIVVIKRILVNNNINSWSAFVIVYILSVILISMLSFHLFEKPFLNLKKYVTRVKTRDF